jgi:FtsP/CotA-like multicopper oxidase with cupredoxin domain
MSHFASDHTSRRTFLRRATAASAALAAGSMGLLASCEPEVASAPPPHPPPVDPLHDGVIATRSPLQFPPTVSPGGLALNATHGLADLGGGQWSNAYLFNSGLPGPTIRANTGDVATITFNNQLTEGSIVHWHGMVVPHADDGHPLQEVGPGGTYAYDFPIVQRAATNWYHPHPHMHTGRQVHQGLAGLFIVNDAQEASLNLPGGAYELPLVIRDALLDANGNLRYLEGSLGHTGPVMLVNGVRDATVNVDTARYRLRILNGSNARDFSLSLSNGRAFQLIGNDGGLLRSRVSVSSITVGPAERVDVIVDFNGLPVGTRVMLRGSTSGPATSLLEFVVTRQVTLSQPLPTVLSNIPVWQRSQARRTRSFTFSGAMLINGLPMDINRIDFQVPFGEIELWRFTSASTNHPVHVHGAYFQVLSRTGGRGRVYPWETGGWKDTVLVQSGETVDVLIRFNTYRGLYLIHCHRLEHEDMGMMSNFEVV